MKDESLWKRKKCAEIYRNMRERERNNIVVMLKNCIFIELELNTVVKLLGSIELKKVCGHYLMVRPVKWKRNCWAFKTIWTLNPIYQSSSCRLDTANPWWSKQMATPRKQKTKHFPSQLSYNTWRVVNQHWPSSLLASECSDNLANVVMKTVKLSRCNTGFRKWNFWLWFQKSVLSTRTNLQFFPWNRLSNEFSNFVFFHPQFGQSSARSCLKTTIARRNARFVVTHFHFRHVNSKLLKSTFKWAVQKQFSHHEFTESSVNIP